MYRLNVIASLILAGVPMTTKAQPKPEYTHKLTMDVFDAKGKAVETVKDVDAFALLGDPTKDKSVTWSVRTRTLAGNTPAVGGAFTDPAGAVWTVTKAGKSGQGERWNCVCTKK